MLRVDVEKFDGVVIFGLLQVQVKNVLKQSRLHKDLNVVGSAKGSESDPNSISLFMGDGDIACRVRGVIFMVCLLYHERGCVASGRSTSLHTHIGLA